MATISSISPPNLQLSSFINGEALPSSSSTLFTGTHLTFPPPLSGNNVPLFVIPKIILGLDKTIRIKKEEQQVNETSIAPRCRPPLKCGKVSPRLLVPNHIRKPPYIRSNLLPEISSDCQIHDAEGIAHMRAACKLAAQILDYAETMVRPSMTTNEIDEAAHQMIIEAGAYPSPLGYGRFPKSVCTSVNECMYHGIPDSRPLQDGDIINIDVAVYLNGYHGDTSKTFLCGNVDDETVKLVKVTEECLHIGISVCKDGAPYRNIGSIIGEHAEKFGYGVDRFLGHGVGNVLHTEPQIFLNCNDQPGTMVEGQTFTIEPILTLGSTEYIAWGDNWTILTADGCPSAQFEHTLLITRSGAEILTQC